MLVPRLNQNNRREEIIRGKKKSKYIEYDAPIFYIIIFHLVYHSCDRLDPNHTA
jgi:hypothetical protein